jgi:hypothetical protein
MVPFAVVAATPPPQEDLWISSLAPEHDPEDGKLKLKRPNYRRFNATLCPLTQPIVFLKAARAGSTSIEEALMKILEYCPGYQEISHNYTLLEHGCTPEALKEQRRIWHEALANNGVISHNPTTDAGGCLSSYYGGAAHLPALLRKSGATVISWTRNNVLRQKYSDYLARKTGDYGGHTTAEAPVWEWSPKSIVDASINGACQMLAIQSAFKLSTPHLDRVLQYEDFANDPYRTVKQVLQWADLKPGYTPEGLLEPHRSWLERRPEPPKPSCAFLFNDSDGVLEKLKAVCLDWTFWGDSYTNTRQPRPMCLNARSCTEAGLDCSCRNPAPAHEDDLVRSWLKTDSPDWWMDQTKWTVGGRVESEA